MQLGSSRELGIGRGLAALAGLLCVGAVAAPVTDLARLALVIGAAGLIGAAFANWTREDRAQLVRNRRNTVELPWGQTPSGYLSGRAWFLLPALVALCSGLRSWQAAVALAVTGAGMVAGRVRHRATRETRFLGHLRWSDSYLEDCRVRWEWGASFVAVFVGLAALGTVAWRQPFVSRDFLSLLGFSVGIGTGIAYSGPFFSLQSRSMRGHWAAVSATWVAWFAMTSTVIVNKLTGSGSLTLAVALPTSVLFASSATWCRRIAVRERIEELRAEGLGSLVEASYPNLAREPT